MMFGSGNDWDGQDKRIDFKNDKLIAAYSYKDAKGREVFIKEKWVLSSGDKKFLIKRHDKRPLDERGGEWDDDLKFDPSGMIIGRGEEEQILYHMDAVENAKEDKSITYVLVEGEKDADNLQKLLGDKFVVTTNSDGGGALLGKDGLGPNLMLHFAGHELIIFHDNDDVGYDHTITAIEMVQSLPEKFQARPVRVVDLPVGETGDVSDYIDILKKDGIKDIAGEMANTIRRNMYDVGKWLDQGRAKLANERRIIKVLSDLNSEDYAEQRVDAAKKLGISVTDLDKRVKTVGGKIGGVAKVLKIAENWVLFLNKSDEEWAFNPDGKDKHCMRLSDKGGQAYNMLTDQYYLKYGSVPQEPVLKDALRTLMSKARTSGIVHNIELRIAEYKGDSGTEIYYDMCDGKGSFIKITKEKWRIVDRCPVMFGKPASMLPQIMPNRIPMEETGRALMKLKQLVIYKRKADFVLNVCLLANFFRPDNFQVMGNFSGGEGTAKSTATKINRSILDPSDVEIQSLPSKEDDLITGTTNSRVMAYDNVSEISPKIQDVLCRILGGSAMTKRKLYADIDQVIIKSHRPVFINGIGSPVTAGDLMDRSVVIRFDPIPKDKRKPENGPGGVWEMFDAAKPDILGALLNMVVWGLAHEGQVEYPEFPRLADFAKWSVDVEGAAGWKGEFVRAFGEASIDNADDVFDADPVSLALWQVMTEFDAVGNNVFGDNDSAGANGRWDNWTIGSTWEITTGNLLIKLNEVVGEDRNIRSDWPRDSTRLRARIDRMQNLMRKKGIWISNRKTNGVKLLTFRKVERELFVQAVNEREEKEWNSWDYDTVVGVNDFTEKQVYKVSGD